MSSTEHNIFSLLAANSTDELSAKSMSDVNTWASESPTNASLLETLSFIEENRSELASYNSFMPVSKANTTRHWMFAIALLLAGLGTIAFMTNSKVNVSEKQTVQYAFLEDRSEVHLFADAKLTELEGFGVDHRTVELSGEAYFDISHDADLPFIIKKDGYTIQVLGTSFTINEESDACKVSVYDGIVKLSNKNQESILLTAGQAGIADANSVVGSTNFAGNKNLVTKEYKDVNVYDILLDLKINYGFDVQFSDKVIASKCFYNGSFQNASFTEILEEFALIFKLEFNIENQGIHIQSISCK